ncbi:MULTISPECIES: hypothetical protein [unclassified Arenibacter]|jgi:hypothetical protein|uniref:hypothetical protein n=1 Tax=unclassified Arenibacter TaxID=2615047 RepID=UPI000E3496F2|nr:MULTISPECIES: hypothetical protein [unclassified Arenibacter]MCM4164378.1 hypothetical protein [Arenibacter sp. A80]RFT56156.1 hypothetical protein D0S24_12305 [Arenibacter sp. P308M17]
MKKGVFLLLMIGVLLSCEKNEVNPSDIKQLGYGTSFGMCVGYCKNEMLLKSDTVIYTRSGWNKQVDSIDCKENLTQLSWDSIKKMVDLNEFFSLQEILGCPDCADGGAEWLEIENFSGKKYKVTFEYGKAPEELETIINALRKQIEKGIHFGEF